jgi:REP element-mobilizing transposase RayT
MTEVTHAKETAMARSARKDIVDPDKVQVFHCVSRCVRRAFLCGEDPYSGMNYDHRRKWIEEMTIELAQYFALDIDADALLSNHMHHVLRTRPDLVRHWSNREVARRWLGIFPKRRDENGKPCKPTDAELREISRDKKRVAELRTRLSSISWFMRRLKEQIAKRANAEDETDGRFWAGRFRMIRLDTEGAVLACAVYVDLNPIRAGIASVPEDSHYTSMWHRIVARQSRLKGKAAAARGRSSIRRFDPHADSWLAPLYDRQLPAAQRYAERGRRASDDAGIAITLDQYLELVDWTGRQIRKDKRGAIPQHLAPILTRLQIDVEHWVDGVRDFSRWVHRIVGTARSMADAAQQMGRRWLHGVSRCRQLFPGCGSSSD